MENYKKNNKWIVNNYLEGYDDPPEEGPPDYSIGCYD